MIEAISASDNGLSPGRHKVIICTKICIIVNWTTENKFYWHILIEIQQFSFTKMRLNMSSAQSGICTSLAQSPPLSLSINELKWSSSGERKQTGFIVRILCAWLTDLPYNILDKTHARFPVRRPWSYCTGKATGSCGRRTGAGHCITWVHASDVSRDWAKIRAFIHENRNTHFYILGLVIEEDEPTAWVQIRKFSFTQWICTKISHDR